MGPDRWEISVYRWSSLEKTLFIWYEWQSMKNGRCWNEVEILHVLGILNCVANYLDTRTYIVWAGFEPLMCTMQACPHSQWTNEGSQCFRVLTWQPICMWMVYIICIRMEWNLNFLGHAEHTKIGNSFGWLHMICTLTSHCPTSHRVVSSLADKAVSNSWWTHVCIWLMILSSVELWGL
jgi:hypothetical protein